MFKVINYYIVYNTKREREQPKDPSAGDQFKHYICGTEYHVDLKNEEASYIRIGKDFQNINLQRQVLKIYNTRHRLC